MGYLKKVLLPGEDVFYRGYVHWMLFLWPMFWLVVAIPFLIISVSVRDAEGVLLGSLISVLIALILGIKSLIKYKTTVFVITNIRVIVKVGFMRISSTEIFFNKIEGVQVEQSFIGKILGFGSVNIIGTGGTKDPIHRISNPLEFQKQVAFAKDAKNIQ